jgi:MFS family permease
MHAPTKGTSLSIPGAAPAHRANGIGALPRRHVLVALTFLGCVIAYTDRVNISVAAVAMKEHFGWTQSEKGLVLSSFFVGYMLCMFIAGVIATRVGGKRVAGVAVLVWSGFTLLTPLAAGISIPVLIAARVGMGMGEAGLFPATYELFGRWIPPVERARASSRFTSGIPLGTVIGLAASGWLVGRYGWPVPFYVFGLAGLLWMLLWFRQVENDPRADARVGAAERGLIESIRVAGDSTTEPVPWRRLLLSRPVLAIVISQFANAWTLYMLLSWLPSYFRDVQGLSIANSGLFSAGPWLAMAVPMNIGGSVSDRMIRGGNARHDGAQDHAVWRPNGLRPVPAGDARRPHPGDGARIADGRAGSVGLHLVRLRARHPGRSSPPQRVAGGILQLHRTDSGNHRRCRHGLACGCDRHLLRRIRSRCSDQPGRRNGVRTLLRCAPGRRMTRW